VNPVRTIAVDERLSSAKIPSAVNQQHTNCLPQVVRGTKCLMFGFLFVLLGCVRRAFQSDRGCYSKIWSAVATRRLQAEASSAETLRGRQILWIAIRRFWSRWKQSLIVVSPDTVVRWHRAGFALYWRVLSEHVESSDGSAFLKQLATLFSG